MGNAFGVLQKLSIVNTQRVRTEIQSFHLIRLALSSVRPAIIIFTSAVLIHLRVPNVNVLLTEGRSVCSKLADTCNRTT